MLESIIFSVQCAEKFPYRTSTIPKKQKNDFSHAIYCSSSMCIKIYTEIVPLHNSNISLDF